MVKKDFIIDLAKLVISAAWADGKLCNNEINALKDLLFRIEEVSEDDWTVLSMYIESPTTESEQNVLLNRVLKSIRTAKDKALVLNILEHLFTCDGKVTPEEQALMDKFRSELSNVDTNIFSRLSKSLKPTIKRRINTVQSSYLREQNSDDYIQNTIYYDLWLKQQNSDITFNQPESELRKICLAAGLLSHIANIDLYISDKEKEAMHEIITADWGLFEKQAALLVNISCDRASKGLDYFRLSQNYYKNTTSEERKDFIKTLFRIADATNKTSYAETEEIRCIAKSLKLSHKDFINAKLT